MVKPFVLCLSRDVVAILKSEGPSFIGLFFLAKTDGARSTFYLNLAKKTGGARPPPPAR